MPNGSGLGVTIGMSEVTWRSARRTEVIVIVRAGDDETLLDETRPISEGFERHFATLSLEINRRLQIVICLLLYSGASHQLTLP